MPKHSLFGRLPRPAPRLHPLALTALAAASALGTIALISPSGTRTPADPVDPVALWLDTGEPARVVEAAAPPDIAPPPLAPSRDTPQPVLVDRPERSTDAEAAGPPSSQDAARLLAIELVAEPPPAAEALPEIEATAGTDATGTAATRAEPPAPTPTSTAATAKPQPSAAAQTAPADDEPVQAMPSRWHDHTVKKGETLAQVLKGFGVDKDDRAKVQAVARGNAALTGLKMGQQIRGRVDRDGGLLELQLKLDAKTSVHVELADDDFRVHTIDRPVEKRLAQTSAVIQSSLFVDGQDAGLSDAQIMELAAIFGWDVDFALGLRPGDRFGLIYEAEYLDGQKIDDGAILAAEFVNQGRTYRAVRFEDDDGTLGYYAPDGTSKKQAFLRSPLKLARVSSGFSLSRSHPILNTRRAHKGVDYSAPVGTPVKATGSGLVAFSGQKNGYGNVVELQHGDKYSTLYGHLSRFAEGLRVGEQVKQGEVIGYVGQTGLATGPHLHYEFRVAGEHRDPLSTKLPTATPLEGQDFAAFRKKAAPLLAQLDRMDRTMLARAP
jgi:murein DD-endopeptidase MepM/ murein hydrolase activator NlpD